MVFGGRLSCCVSQNMEKDKALERRFQQVFVKQPNVEDTVSPPSYKILYVYKEVRYLVEIR